MKATSAKHSQRSKSETAGSGLVPFLLSTTVLLTWTGLAAGATLHVGDGGAPNHTTIQAAISAAANGDQISVGPGTYYEAIDFQGKAICLFGRDGPSVTVINGDGNHHVVRCVRGEGPGTILEGFTITGGNAVSGIDADNYGGGMYNSGSSPTVINCVFTGNSASHGGGMLNNDKSSPTLTNCAFHDNSCAGGDGGGIANWANSHPLVTDCTFSNNSATWGGGMFSGSGSNPTITKCTFSNNTASATGRGGGMANQNSSPNVVDCAFNDNSAQLGGGMASQGGIPTIVRGVFSNNSATYGGGMFSNSGSNPIVADCTFAGNAAVNDGGGVHTSQSSPAVTNCIFTGNSAVWGGGMSADSSCTPRLTNCTFVDNSATYGGGFCNYDIKATLTNCILWSNSVPQIYVYGTQAPTVTYSDIQGGFPGTGNVNAAPEFVDDADFHLTAGSPCIDAGTNNPVGGLPAADIESNSRPRDDDGDGMSVADMGAYESPVASRSHLSALCAITVAIEPEDVRNAGVQWRIDDNPWLASGDICQDVSPGYHTVEFSESPLWVRPDDRRVLVGRGHGNIVTARYEPIKAFVVGDIPPQTVWEGQTLKMRVYAAENRPNDRVLASVSTAGKGESHWDPVTGVFTYTPTGEDKHPFTVTFTTQDPPVLEQVVEISPVPALPEEQSSLGGDPAQSLPDPESRSYWFVRERFEKSAGLNHQTNPNVRHVTIVGKKVVFAKGHANGLWDSYSHRKDDPIWDLERLTIYAESVIIRSPLHLPQTDVTICARDLRFEDVNATERACVITTPISGNDSSVVPASQFQNGRDGLKAGDITLHIESLYSTPGYDARLLLDGGDGQDGGAGQNGTPGPDMATWSADPYHPGHTVYVKRRQHSGREPYFGEEAWPDGGDAIAGGQAGSAGDGGSIATSYDIVTLSNYTRRPGGSAGKVPRNPGGQPGTPSPAYWLDIYYLSDGNTLMHDYYAAHYPVWGASARGKPAKKQWGEHGRLIGRGNAYSWLNPYALRMILAYARDAYVLGHAAEARDIIEEYHERLSVYTASSQWTDLEERWQLDLGQMHDEMAGLLDQIQNNLDYFGHPAGWVPLLSFEVRKAAYEDEVAHSMDVLYLSYWLQKRARNIQDKRTALENGVQKAWQDIQQFNDDLGLLQDLISAIQTELADIDQKKTACMQELQHLEQTLAQRAQDNVSERHKVPKWKKYAKVAATICQVMPVGQPYFAGVGAGLTFISQADSGDPLENVLDRVGATSEYYQGYGKAAATYREKSESIDLKVLRQLDEKGAIQYIKDLYAYSQPLLEAAAEIRRTLKETQVPASEVEAELSRIKADSPEFNAVVDKIARLVAEKEMLGEKIGMAMQQVTERSAAITQNCLAITEMNQGVSQTYSALDLNTVMYLREMERRARDRLLKYHYYMAKAYEYRMLESYPGDLLIQDVIDNIVDMFENIAQGSPVDSGSATQPDSVCGDLGLQDYQSLKALYTAQLSGITEQILDAYEQTQNGTRIHQLRTSVTLGLSADEIKKLNDTGQIMINLNEAGRFSPGERDIRIVSIDMSASNIEVAGPLSRWADLELCITHQGMSRILTPDGKVLQFRHRSSLSNDNPLVWGALYDCFSKSWTAIAPSPSNETLLQAVLPTLRENAPMYSRPGAWGDLLITRTVNTDNGINLVINDLRLEVAYDFVKTSSQAELDVRMTDPTMCPYIELSVADLNGRQDGIGSFTRVYEEGEVVILTAPETYGRFVFDHWADRFGNTLTDDLSLSMTLVQDTTALAHFVCVTE